MKTSKERMTAGHASNCGHSQPKAKDCGHKCCLCNDKGCESCQPKPASRVGKVYNWPLTHDEAIEMHAEIDRLEKQVRLIEAQCQKNGRAAVERADTIDRLERELAKVPDRITAAIEGVQVAYDTIHIQKAERLAAELAEELSRRNALADLNTTLEGELVEAKEIIADSMAVVKVKDKTITTLHTALDKYGRHKDCCERLANETDGVCTCGLDSAKEKKC